MTTIGVLFLILIFLMVVLMIRNSYYGGYDDGFDEETTHTTTTTTTTTVVEPQQPEYVIVGTLQRQTETNGQQYVIDPVDKDKIYVNIGDDLYQDGAGQVWQLS
jgi:hypothetical protein